MKCVTYEKPPVLWPEEAAELSAQFPKFLEKCFTMLHPGEVFLPNWHIRLMGEYLQACREGEIQRLIINIPPRSLKSMTVSVAWPAFLLGHNPSERIMAASYASGLSLRHSLDCRHIMRSEWYRLVFPEVSLAKDQNQKHKFATTEYGQRFATSVGGTATGEGANFLIMDDPLSPAQAESRAAREKANRWFDQTFVTRLNDKRKGVIVVVMQRLHDEDLTGHLLEKGGWEHLCIPAITERFKRYHIRKLTIDRQEGSLLHVAREDAALLERAKRELGSVAFSAQYQQNPLPMEGGTIKRQWLSRYLRMPEPFDRVVQSWDTAVKTGLNNDASACVTIGERDGKASIIHVFAGRLEYPALKRKVLQQAEDWQPNAILIEDKASGQSLLQDLRAAPHSHLSLIAINPCGDKITRLARVSAMIEAGQVLLPQEEKWLAELEIELLGFPHSKHDDRVDALAQYLNWAREQKLRGNVKVGRF